MKVQLQSTGLKSSLQLVMRTGVQSETRTSELRYRIRFQSAISEDWSPVFNYSFRVKVTGLDSILQLVRTGVNSATTASE